MTTSDLLKKLDGITQSHMMSFIDRTPKSSIYCIKTWTILETIVELEQ